MRLASHGLVEQVAVVVTIELGAQVVLDAAADQLGAADAAAPPQFAVALTRTLEQ